jgi:thiol:disulfide interchange protein DsbD
MRKVIITVSLLFAFCLTLLSQIHEPVKWTFDKKELSETSAELIFKATIESKWHLYGMNIPDGGPVATKVVFEKLTGAELSGTVTTAQKATENYDPNFLMALPYYENKVDFRQKIKIKDKKYAVTGYVEYMVCNDETCLAPVQEPFQFSGTQTEVASTSPETPSISVVENLTPITPVVNTSENYWDPIIDLLHDSPIGST